MLVKFSELSIQPSLNAVLIPRGVQPQQQPPQQQTQEATNSPQDEAGTSAPADQNDAATA